MRAEDVFDFIVAVDVAGDEVDGNIFVFAVSQEAVGPGGLRGGGSADTEAGADALDG